MFKFASYSVSSKGESSAKVFDLYTLDNLRKELIKHNTVGDDLEIYVAYDIMRDGHGRIGSYRRYKIGNLNTKTMKWKSKKTGKTYNVNPKNGKLIKKRK